MTMEVYLGTVMATAINFTPRGWAPCSGQLMSISQNSALFALLGTTYGGDGVSTFGLPDLRGRTVIGAGNGPGLSARIEGEKNGAESAVGQGTASGALTIGVANLPSHNHTASAALTASTTLKVGTEGGGVGLPVAGAGLTSSVTGPGSAAIYAAPAPTSGTVNLGNVSTALSGAVDATGSGTPLPVSLNTNVTTSTMQPFLALNYIIATEGLFPSRN
jgi:microcystin-dependent protein